MLQIILTSILRLGLIQEMTKSQLRYFSVTHSVQNSALPSTMCQDIEDWILMMVNLIMSMTKDMKCILILLRLLTPTTESSQNQFMD